jgi:hypothetical protein
MKSDNGPLPLALERGARRAVVPVVFVGLPVDEADGVVAIAG